MFSSRLVSDLRATLHGSTEVPSGFVADPTNSALHSAISREQSKLSSACIPQKKCAQALIRFLALSCVVLASGFNSSVTGQRVTIVGDRESCAACKLTIERIATLGSMEGSAALGGWVQAIAQDRNGNYYVSTHRDPGEIRIYERSGRFRNVIGRKGQGPGEFNDVDAIAVVPNDTFYVFDDNIWRLTVLDRNHEFVRSHQVAAAGYINEVRPLPNGLLLVSANIRTPQAVGLPLHLMRRDGQILKSFGNESGAYRADLPRLNNRTIDVATDGTIWVGHPTQYVVEAWNIHGTMLRQLVRQVDWFKPYYQFTDVTPNAPPQPYLLALRVDSVGRIWILSTVHSPDYRLGLASRPTPIEGRLLYSFKDITRLHHTMLEVIDPRSSAVVKRLRMPLWANAWISDTTFVAYREGKDGEPLFDVWQVRLTEPRRK